MSELQSLQSAVVLGSFAFLVVYLGLFTSRFRIGLPNGWRGTFLRSALSIICATLLLLPVFTWLGHLDYAAVEKQAKQQGEVATLVQSITRHLASRDASTSERPKPDANRLRADRQELEAILQGVLDVSVGNLDHSAKGNWHLAILLVERHERDPEPLLRVVVASAVLRNSDGVNFAMRTKEGAGGRMWADWEEQRVPVTTALGRADLEESYQKSLLLPPRDLRLAKDVSACGVCVMIPPSDQHPKQIFPGMLCLGSTHSGDFPCFQSAGMQAKLFQLARDLSYLVGRRISLGRDIGS